MRPRRTQARTIGLASCLIAVTVAVVVAAVLVFAPGGDDDARTGPGSGVTEAPTVVPFGGFDTALPTLLKGQTSDVASVAINGSGAVAATGGEDGKIILYDAYTGKSTATLVGVHSGRVDALAFSPDGNILASGGMDKTVELHISTNGDVLVYAGDRMDAWLWRVTASGAVPAGTGTAPHGFSGRG